MRTCTVHVQGVSPLMLYRKPDNSRALIEIPAVFFKKSLEATAEFNDSVVRRAKKRSRRMYKRFCVGIGISGGIVLEGVRSKDVEMLCLRCPTVLT